ncbi:MULTISPECIES: hypothetical protein [unclassified Cyanobium]|uniref:hypothetical protein n=1 Tax=unclassified Cyanobium TaxID=2627006 RepID=UPI0020CDD2F4|nr:MULTISPECIES: hypothetical protein [unclassified Cyanobium]MCP9861305.1 hypothetical protein [Cyanobium sp. Cruz-8H5]MCP9868561.1 hypothetical protein [Cyanobium sp. Cruz-8D1]
MTALSGPGGGLALGHLATALIAMDPIVKLRSPTLHHRWIGLLGRNGLAAASPQVLQAGLDLLDKTAGLLRIQSLPESAEERRALGTPAADGGKTQHQHQAQQAIAQVLNQKGLQSVLEDLGDAVLLAAPLTDKLAHGFGTDPLQRGGKLLRKWRAGGRHQSELKPEVLLVFGLLELINLLFALPQFQLHRALRLIQQANAAGDL